MLKAIFPVLGGRSPSMRYLTIPTWNEQNASIEIVGEGKKLHSIPYSSQCEKMSAFKKALMWLLDNSDIRKNERTEKLSALESKLDETKEEIRRIK